MNEPDALFINSSQREVFNKAVKKLQPSLGYRSYLKFNLNFLDFQSSLAQKDQVFGYLYQSMSDF
jgi:hypothetical protein